MYTNLDEHRISNTNLQNIFYIPDFVSEEEESLLIRKIHETPLPRWKNLNNRRLQLWGGQLSPHTNILISEDMPQFVSDVILPKLLKTSAFVSSPHKAPNHIIVNEYLPGQGIMPHKDGPAYHPVVATISLGSHAVFHYYSPEDTSPVLSLVLEPRSVVITMREAYEGCLHGIDSITTDTFTSSSSLSVANKGKLTNPQLIKALEEGQIERETRYSLTCRDVEKVKDGTRLLKAFMGK